MTPRQQQFFERTKQDLNYYYYSYSRIITIHPVYLLVQFLLQMVHGGLPGQMKQPIIYPGLQEII